MYFFLLIWQAINFGLYFENNTKKQLVDFSIKLSLVKNCQREAK